MASRLSIAEGGSPGTSLESSAHVLYRFFAADGVLLYVGITCNPSRRFEKHGDDKPWWLEVARIELQQFADRVAVLAAERTAIATEQPRYNVRLTTPRDPARPERRASTPRVTLPCALEVGEVYALGLRDGTCRVGLVSDESNEDGIVLTLYSWLMGDFNLADEWVSAEEIAQWRKADWKLWKEEGQTRSGWFIEAGTKVFDMDPLADFQTDWQRRPR